MGATSVTQHVKAPRFLVYRALLDEHAVARWQVPDGMTSRIHAFEPREGGGFTDDAALRGEMTITIRLSDADGGTRVDAVHENLPPGLSAAGNELGWRMSLAKLAALVEGRRRTPAD